MAKSRDKGKREVKKKKKEKTPKAAPSPFGDASYIPRDRKSTRLNSSH